MDGRHVPEALPKLKPDTYVYFRDNVPYEHFVAYSLEEDGAISPKFYICPPSLLVKECIYTGASCNSLFHFHDKTLGHILWNTATDHLKFLPKPLPELSPHESLFYALGSGHQSEDYKLMHFARSDSEDRMIYYIDLYSLKTNSWKRIPCPEFLGVDRSFAFIFGVLYCVVFQNQDFFILSFDISTETFSSLPLPMDNSMCGSRLFFLEYKGLLSALERCDHQPDVYELWIMIDGLWTSESGFRTCGVKHPLWFSQDGKLLYFASLTDELVVFDRATGKVKHLGVVCSLAGKPMMIPFSESLVDLYRVSDIEDRITEMWYLYNAIKPSFLYNGVLDPEINSSAVCYQLNPPCANYYIPPPCIRDLPTPSVSEKTRESVSSCSDTSPNSKPKPDIIVHHRDNDLLEYFAAYSLTEDGNLSPKYYIYPPSVVAKHYFFTGATCNGLLHFHGKKSGHVLWNPTMSHYKILPEPSLELPPNHRNSLSVSFGMWSSTEPGDYKVMHMLEASLEGEERWCCKSWYYIDLYSLKTNTWRRIPCPEFVNVEENTCAVVSGVFYCEATRKETGDRVLLSFDISTETFSSLPLPFDGYCRYYFLEYKGLLSAFEYYHNDSDANDGVYHGVYCAPRLWIMKDASWKRVSDFSTCGVPTPLWFSQDGKLLYFAGLIDELLVFDRATQELKHLGVSCTSGKPMMIPFFESSVELSGNGS